MTWWLLAPALAAGLLAVQGVPAGDDILRPKQASVERPKGPRGAEWLRESCSGIVTAVTDRTITVAHQGSWVETLDAKGRSLGVEVIPPQPPRTFQACPALASGGFSRARGASYSYRLSDVLVGDWVDIDCRGEGGGKVCHAISILRRPGGRVPPAPGEDLNPIFPDTPKWHDQMNAWADWEERGIPFPDKYHPGGNQAGVAPMPHDRSRPREVAPGVPTIPAAKD